MALASQVSRFHRKGNRMGFIEDYIAFTANSESPRIFHEWCGLFAVSACLARRCFCDFQIYTIYPNLFVVLVASSGRQRKSTAIGIAENFLRSLEPQPNFISQKVTPEALIEAMRVKDKVSEKVILQERNEGIVLADELATFLNKHSYESGLGSILIPLFDCKGAFEYHTKGGGKQSLKDTYLGILGGSTVDWLSTTIPEAAVGAGLTSRFIFVNTSDIPKPVPFPWIDATLKESLIAHLARMSTLSGPFKFRKEAVQYYMSQYTKWMETSKLLDDRMLSGYASRRYVHAIKLAMLFSASERDDLVIEQEHIEKSEQTLLSVEKNMPMVMSLITSTEQGNIMSSIERLIYGGVDTYSAILRCMSNKINTMELQTFLDTLEKAGRIDKHFIGSDASYRPPNGRK